MKLISRIPAAMLAAMLVSASMLSCGDSAAQPTETQADTVAVTAPVTEAVENVPVYEQDDLPADLDFGGATTHIFGWEGSGNDEFFVDAENGDIVNDALYARNRAVEERLNLTMTFTLAPGAYNDRGNWVKLIKQSTMAGDGANDIVAGYSMSGATLANSRLITDLMELDYLNFEKPWWPESLIKEATCGGKLYFCSGDISTNMIYMLYATYFNKSIAKNYDIDPDGLYELVLDGKWTLDKLIELSSGMYMDLDGDGKKSVEDRYGFTTHSVWSDAFFFASGLRTTTVGDDGLPHLSEEFGGEKTQALLQKLLDNFYSKNDMFYGTVDNQLIRDQFLQERALFLTTEIYFATNHLRDSQVEYGILPMPKYDELQEDYYTVSSFPYTLYGIPVDAKDPSMSAAILECMASESYRTVSPALFEVALKVKYAGDDDASAMYDIIRGSNVFDIGRIFNDSVNGKTYSMFRSCLMDNQSAWISTYEKNVKTLTKSFDKVIANLLEEQ